MDNKTVSGPCRPFLILSIICTILATCSAKCPCKTEDLCKPVTKKYAKELVVFSCDAATEDWKKYNWTEITHVIVCKTQNISEIYCHAHANQVRVTQLAGLVTESFPLLEQYDFRQQLIKSWLNDSVSNFLDGVNMDIEGAAFTSEIKQAIVDLTQETREAYKAVNSNYIVTFDIPYSPFVAGCLSFYCFDYVGIAKYTDYMIVMGYDANIDIFQAQANSPLFVIEQGLNQYINNVSIDPNQLVLALPWYGYDFTCEYFLNNTGHEICLILGAGHLQRGQNNIWEILLNNTVPVMLNEHSQSVYFTVRMDGAYHQIWFDNSRTLWLKYDVGISLGIKGFSMWQAGALDYNSDNQLIQNGNDMFWNDITRAMIKLKGSA